MIVERSMSEGFLTNNYVVADELGGHAVMIDAGGPVEPLFEYLRRGQLTLTHVLLTHHHSDHVIDIDRVAAAHPDVPILIHELERPLVPQATGTRGRSAACARRARPPTPTSSRRSWTSC